MIGTRPARLLALLLVGGVILFAPLASGAQEKFKSSWSARPENTKVTFQHVLEIPDVPGHTIRLYEYHRTWPDNPPIMAGLKVVEEVTRGFADAIVGSGLSRGYAFWRFVRLAHSTGFFMAARKYSSKAFSSLASVWRL